MKPWEEPVQYQTTQNGEGKVPSGFRARMKSTTGALEERIGTAVGNPRILNAGRANKADGAAESSAFRQRKASIAEDRQRLPSDERDRRKGSFGNSGRRRSSAAAAENLPSVAGVRHQDDIAPDQRPTTTSGAHHDTVSPHHNNATASTAAASTAATSTHPESSGRRRSSAVDPINLPSVSGIRNPELVPPGTSGTDYHKNSVRNSAIEDGEHYTTSSGRGHSASNSEANPAAGRRRSSVAEMFHLRRSSKPTSETHT